MRFSAKTTVDALKRVILLKTPFMHIIGFNAMKALGMVHTH